MKTISRYIMTLALLLTAVTGAWATDGVKLTTTEIVPPAAWNKDYTYLLPSDMPGLKADGITEEQAKAWADVPKSGNVDLIYGYVDAGEYIDFKIISFIDGQVNSSNSRILSHNSVYNDIVKYYYATGVVEPGVEVTWNASTKTGTFAMPGSDVVLTPIYAKAAAFATTGTEPEVKTLLPAAAEGVIAGTDASLIAEGTGIVAFAGTSTEDTQGTLMYAIGTSATEAPALTAFSATVPTAKDIADDGATVYVWYYIQGADAPEGQTATAENTFNDSEICAEPIKVTVLTNKFDITFKAANANTIEAGKATVTVGGTAATVTEGKLEGVKMGSEVKMTAKEGYKFRKVEVKKKAAGPKYADVVTICEKNGDNMYLISSFFDGTNANITTITKEEAIALAEYLGGGDIRVVYDEYEYYSYRYVRTTNAAGNVTGALLSTTNTFNLPLYYVPAGN